MLLRVDRQRGRPLRPRPQHRVGDERGAHPAALGAWLHSEPLQVGAPVGDAADRIAAAPTLDSEPVEARGAQRVVEAELVEAPERVGERRVIDGEHAAAVPRRRSAQAAGGGGGHRDQVVVQQVQVLVGAEPGSEPRSCALWIQRWRQHGPVPRSGGVGGRVLQRRSGGPGAGRHEEGEIAVTSPRAVVQRGAGAGRGVGHGGSRCAADARRLPPRGRVVAGRCRAYARGVTLLLATDPAHAEHLTSVGHPERPERLDAVLAGVEDLHLDTDLHLIEPRRATVDELLLVHDASVVDLVQRLHELGGGSIDADTAMGPASLDAALLAAGAGLAAIDALRSGEGEVAFCAVRPPGHHATPQRSMGFCLFNNAAIAARSLADAGERVVVVDIDAHHGNGTADAFVADPRVLYVSLHQWPLYPGTGRHDEVGTGSAAGTTLNVPMPPGATGDVYLRAWDELVAPAVERFEPSWLLVSAGFDAHRRDPLTDLALSAGDFADLAGRLGELAPAGRRLVLLEGGYDLAALRMGTSSLLAGLLGEHRRDEDATAGGPGADHVEALVRWWATIGAERCQLET